MILYLLFIFYLSLSELSASAPGDEVLAPKGPVYQEFRLPEGASALTLRAVNTVIPGDEPVIRYAVKYWDLPVDARFFNDVDFRLRITPSMMFKSACMVDERGFFESTTGTIEFVTKTSFRLLGTRFVCKDSASLVVGLCDSNTVRRVELLPREGEDRVRAIVWGAGDFSAKIPVLSGVSTASTPGYLSEGFTVWGAPVRLLY